MNKILEKVLKDYKKANQARKQTIILKYGFNSENEFLIYLNNELIIKPTVSEKTKQSVETIVKPTVHLVDIIDTSGSMIGLKIINVIKGLQKELKNIIDEGDKHVNYTYSLYSFSDYNNYNQHYYLENVNNKLVIPNFKANGGTALYDAVGKTLNMLSKFNDAKPNEKFLVKIYTDGGENDSILFNKKHLSELIPQLEKKGFTITFVGTDNDVKSIIKNIKIDESNTLTYNGTGEDLAQAFYTATVSRSKYAENLSKGEDVSRGFFKKVGTL